MLRAYHDATLEITLAMAIIFAITSIWLTLRLYRVKKKSTVVLKEPAVPADIKKATQDVAQQVDKLRRGLNRLANSKNPMEALVNAISRDPHNAK